MKRNNLKAIICLLITLCILSFAGVKSGFFGLISNSAEHNGGSSLADSSPKNSSLLVNEQKNKIPAQSAASPAVLKVHYIDVGQGDSILIELPNDEKMLIDGGPRSAASKVTSYINNMGIKKLDYVIATHPHEDHIGGLPKVLSDFQVGTFYMPNKEHSSNIFISLLDAVQKNGCRAVYAKSGKELISTDTLKVYFAAPVSDNYSSLNNYSAVIKIEYLNTSFLFTGDAEDIAEHEIISQNYDLKADVLKVGHHGSKTSSTDAFLQKVKPKYAIISVGSNSYDHPSQEVIARLAGIGAKIYTTKACGTIIIEADGNNYTLSNNATEIIPHAPPTDNVDNEHSVKALQTDTDNSSVGTTVYRTRSGECYHSQGCSYLKSCIEIALNEAKTLFAV